MKIIAETKNYAVVQVPEIGNKGHTEWSKAMETMLEVCENLLDKGYRPLHYNPRISSWVCEKHGVKKAA